jgi:hypothetical protein
VDYFFLAEPLRLLDANALRLEKRFPSIITPIENASLDTAMLSVIQNDRDAFIIQKTFV